MVLEQEFLPYVCIRQKTVIITQAHLGSASESDEVRSKTFPVLYYKSLQLSLSLKSRGEVFLNPKPNKANQLRIKEES